MPAVRHLIEYERNSLAAADTIAAAEGVVAAQPDVLLHRIVAQFQHLFDCHRLEGVLPALNQVRSSFFLYPYCGKPLPPQEKNVFCCSPWQAVATTREGFFLLLTMASSCHHKETKLFVDCCGTTLPPHAKLVDRAVTDSARQLFCGRMKLFATIYVSAVIDFDKRAHLPLVLV